MSLFLSGIVSSDEAVLDKQGDTGGIGLGSLSIAKAGNGHHRHQNEADKEE